MRSRSYITAIKGLALLILVISSAAILRAGDRIALLTPDPSPISISFAAKLSEEMKPIFVVVDEDLAKAAYSSRPPSTPFNMSLSEAKGIASVIGCELFVLVKAATQRRNAAGRGEYYEAFAVIYLVSGRTGRLIYWDLQKAESRRAEGAENALLEKASSVAGMISQIGRARLWDEIREPSRLPMEEPRSDSAAEAKDLKLPIPFRRIKPEYTSIAAFYEAAGTVEIEVDLDAEGRILRTEITKWAGFGLDESVEKAVRQMNWRPAERSGKFLPMSFVLRYNFKKIEKD